MKKRITSTKKFCQMMLAALFLLSLPAFAQSELSVKNGTKAKSATRLTEANRKDTKIATPQNEKQDPKVENASPFDAVKGKREDFAKRDLFSKHYRNDDGSYTAMIGAGPIHYEKDGQFYDIDHNITTSGDAVYPYVNKTNLFESHFGATAHQGIKNKTKEGEITEFLNTKMYWEVNGQAVNSQLSNNTTVTIQGDKAYYNNLYGSIAAEFAIESGRRKLNYVIPNAQALGNIPASTDYLVFTEDIKLQNDWTHTVSKNGILIKDSKGKQIYLYENPVSTDSGLLSLRELNNTIFETTLNGNVLTIKTKVKTSWLLNGNRQFPINVDPTTNAQADGGRSVFNTNSYTQTLGYFGRDNDGYSAYWSQYHIRFNVSSIPSGSTVTATTGYIYKWGNAGFQNGNQWHWSISSDPTTTSGLSLYNSASSGLSGSSAIPSGAGWLNNVFTGNLSYIETGINGTGRVSAAVRPVGTYGIENYYAVRTHTETDKPYLSIIYTEPITDRTLTVAGAYTGASYGNGSHTLNNNASVTATSGTRSGYNVTGWTGTGSTTGGTGGTATFTITENTTINWQWQQVGMPNNVAFYNTGGSEQLAFNNSRVNTANPVFRLSHATDPASQYQIEINTAPNFTGTGWIQNFNNTYPANTQTNFTFTNASLVNGTTYYVRARVRGAANVDSSWTTETYSFTYETTNPLANWFQTTQAQFQTDILSGVVANASHDIVTGAGGNIVTNGAFTTNTSGWTITGTSGSNKVANLLNNPNSWGGGNWLQMGSPNFGTGSNGTGSIIVAQQIDLTGVSEITFNAGNFYSVGGPFDPAPNTISTFKIGGTLTDTAGTTEATISQMGSGQGYSWHRQDKTVNVSAYTGVHVIKFVMTYNANWGGNGSVIYFFDDITANAAPSGTITSTPFSLASVNGAGTYDKIEWNQTLGGGTLNLKVQGSATANGTYSDISGYTAISATGSAGMHDISGINAITYPHIRLVGSLNGANVVLHDWAIYGKEPCVATITSVTPASATICGGTSASFTAVANDSNHEIRWYAAASGGSVLYTGDTFETPNLTATTTYYVAAYDSNTACESVRTAVAVTVNQISSSINVSIGTPANGDNHYINVNWAAISGAWQYQVDYSWNNTTWSTGGFSTTTSFNLNLFNNPDREVFIRVKRYDNGGLPDCYAYAAPIYTAADNPAALTFGTVSGTSVQVIIPAETPVANPAHTTYSIYNETLGLYVQADGSLGATEVFQTKTVWSSTPVTGLQPETEYCFYAKAKNQDGDIVGGSISISSETFTTNANFDNVSTNSPANKWWTPPSPGSGIAMAYMSSDGCTGGNVGYQGTNNNFASFLRSPATNCNGLNTVTMTFDISNSHFASEPNSKIYFNMYAPTTSSPGGTYINAISVNGVNTHELYFSEVRTCEKITVVYDLTNVTNKSSVYFYLNAAKGYSSSTYFYFRFDNISILEAAETSCITTGSACEAEIASVTGGAGCSSIALSAATNDDNTYVVNWYDAATNGNLIHTGFTYNATVSATTSYWVAASDGTCESGRTEVIATYTPTDAEMMFWTPSATACSPEYVMLYAETMDDGAYTVNWYTTETGGTAFHTGYDLEYYITNTVTLYVAAVDSEGCESTRESIEITMEGRVWNGSVSSNWDTAANWSPAVIPTIDECVTIPATSNNPVITANASAKILTLLANAELLVETGASITVYDEVIVNNTADFTLENDGYLVQIVGGQINKNVGQITVHKNSTPMYRLEATGWSSPVENQGLYAFSPETVFGRIYAYNETTNAFSNTGITQSSTFALAQGYSVRAPNGFPTYSSGMNRANDAEIFSGVFNGRPNNGTIGVNVTKNSNGNNYIGNPYPSPIDAYDFLAGNASLEALYFWSHEAPPTATGYAANNYATLTGLGPTASASGSAAPDGIINVGQGFIAKTNQSVLLQFTNTLRMNYSDNQFFRQRNIERHRFWLNLNDDQIAHNQILLGYAEDATYGFDHKIDGKFFDYPGSAIYSLINNEKYTIQGRPLPFDSEDIVPLGFKTLNQGVFNIAIDHADGFFNEGQTIYLKDNYTNNVHNLSDNGAYSFASETGTFDDRFEIVYSEALSNPDFNWNNNWIVYKAENQIHVKTTGFDIETVEVYDLTGRLLISRQNIGSNNFSYPANFADQVLLVKVNGNLVKKVL